MTPPHGTLSFSSFCQNSCYQDQGNFPDQSSTWLILSSFCRTKERKWNRSLLLFATPWTVAYQAPLSMGFSRQEYWSGVPSPCHPGDISWPRDQIWVSCTAGWHLTVRHQGNPCRTMLTKICSWNILEQNKKIQVVYLDSHIKSHFCHFPLDFISV